MKNKKLIYMIVGFSILVVIFAGLLIGRGISTDEELDSVQVKKGDQTLTVNRDGSVVLLTPDGTFQDQWSAEKTRAFFSYFEDNAFGEGEYLLYLSTASGTQSVAIGDDELVNIVIDETSGGGGTDDGEGEDIDDYFGGGGSPTPPPGGGSGSGGGSGGSGGGSSDDDTCLFWRISYCVEFPPDPTPPPTPTPQAVEIKPPDCGANQETGRTVISSELCLVTPSPSPTP